MRRDRLRISSDGSAKTCFHRGKPGGELFSWKNRTRASGLGSCRHDTIFWPRRETTLPLAGPRADNEGVSTTTDKRRWYQFSVRSLLVMVTLFTVTVGWFLGWIQFRRQRAQENRDRVATVEKAMTVIDAKIISNYKELRPQTWLERQFDDPGDADDPVGELRVWEVYFWLKVTDAGLEHLKVLTKLDTLHLSGTNVTDAGLKHLKGLTSLERLYLSDTDVTDDGLEHLNGLTNLEWLNLSDTDVTDAGLVTLKELTKLQVLYLNDTNITDAGLEHLKGRTKFQRLHLGGTKVSNTGLEHLKGLTKLTFLNLDETNVTDAGVDHLKWLTSLESLHLSNTKVSDAGLEHLKRLTELKELYLNDTNITDAGLEHLKGLKHLRSLMLNNTNVTDKGVKKLQQSLPNCVIHH